MKSEKFGGSGRGVENGTRDGGGVETFGGDGSETELVTKKKVKKVDGRCRCQPHTGLQG